MPENEFDRQVKKMMDELKLKPTDGVWPGVEKRIRENKRRKRSIIFLPVIAGLLLLGYISFNYFNSETENKNTSTNEETIKKENENLPYKEITPEPKKQIGIKNPLADKPSLKKQPLSSKDKMQKIYALKKEPLNKKFRSLNIKATDNSLSIVATEKKHHNIDVNEDKNVKMEDSFFISRQKNEKSDVTKSDSIQVNVQNDTIRIKDETIIKSDTSLFQQDSVTKVLTAQIISISHKQDKSVTWGFHLSTGISGVRNAVFKLNQNRAYAATSVPNSGTGSSTYGRRVPNSSKTGIAFKIGTLLEKKFSQKSSFDIGIQYSYYSDQIKVGYRTDSVIRVSGSYSADLLVSGFYPNTSQNNYINRYHFVEFPINYHFKMLQGKQNSLRWDFGLTVGQLLSTNSLVFDTTNGGVYYTDKKLIRKLSANLSTGFSISFNEHKSTQWIIGPQVQFGLNNLYKNYTDKKAYPFFAGVDLRLMFPKK